MMGVESRSWAHLINEAESIHLVIIVSYRCFSFLLVFVFFFGHDSDVLFLSELGTQMDQNKTIDSSNCLI